MKKPTPGACNWSALRTLTIGTANAGDCGAGAAVVPQPAPVQSPAGDLDKWTPAAVDVQSTAEPRALAIGIDPMLRSALVTVALSEDVCTVLTPMPVQSNMAALA